MWTMGVAPLLAISFHVEPSQRKSIPRSPPIQASVVLTAQTVSRLLIEGTLTVAQLLPSKRMTMPLSPTAQTLLALTPQMSFSATDSGAGVMMRDQRVPSQCNIVPPSPTAHTSVLPLPQMASRLLPVGTVKRRQTLPSQCT